MPPSTLIKNLNNIIPFRIQALEHYRTKFPLPNKKHSVRIELGKLTDYRYEYQKYFQPKSTQKIRQIRVNKLPKLSRITNASLGTMVNKTMKTFLNELLFRYKLDFLLIIVMLFLI